MGRDDQGIARSHSRYQVIPRTLCFITNRDDVLLLHGGPEKKLWAGLYNGVGGHVEAGEDIYNAAQREIQEETGLAVTDLCLRGVIHADAGDAAVGIVLFVFTAQTVSREVTPSPEGTLEWIPKTDLPSRAVVEDLPVLLPRVLAMGPHDPPFFAAYAYDAGDHLVVSFATPR
jgi:8-oxo-dGTP diphosphatase